MERSPTRQSADGSLASSSASSTSSLASHLPDEGRMEPLLVETPRLRLLSGDNHERGWRPRKPGRTFRPGSGDPRIGVALHAAQSTVMALEASGSGRPHPRTLDELIAMEQLRGWSHVFKELKSEGLLEEQTLGHVVARWTLGRDRRRPFTSQPPVALRSASSLAPSRIGSR